jgi:DNA-binding CsgD family transcriptional regulator
MSHFQQDHLPKIENIHADFCKEVSFICKPLHLLGIHYFHFIRSFNDNSRISLSNNRAFSEHYYKKKFYLRPAVDKKPNGNKSASYLWISLNNKAVFQDLRSLFDIDNGITIVRSFSCYSDYYYFGSSPENIEINNFYLEKYQMLERFIAYFIDSASGLINKAKKNRIVIPFTQGLITPNKTCHPKEDDIIQVFIGNTPIKKYRVCDGIRENIFSPRQMDCIFGILDGKTAKDISREHNLSVRTIENYISNLKIKLSCDKKNELIKKLKNLSILGRF